MNKRQHSCPDNQCDDHDMEADLTDHIEHGLSGLIERSDWSAALSTLQTIAPGTMSSTELAAQFGRMGGSPLHCACQRGAPRSVIAELLRVNPSAALTTCGPENRLPIHDACSARVSRDSIHLLLETFPGGAMTAKSDGSLPIHIACETHPDCDVIATLIAAFPQGLCTKNAMGRLPIHVATANRAARDVTELLLQSNPSAAYQGDNLGYLPIHLPFIAGGSLAAVEPLFRVYPAGLSVAGANGDLAIHSACFWDAQIDAVQFLIAHSPRGLCIRNNDGYLPLHAAVEHNAPEEMLKEVLAPYPEAMFLPQPHNNCSVFEEVRERDHHQVRLQGCTSFVAVVRKVFSNGTDGRRDERGRSLIHVACAARASTRDFQTILAHDREQLKLQDGRGRLPLHLVAAFANSRIQFPSVGLIMDFIQAYPDALGTPTQNGQLPFTIACVSDVSLDVLYELLRQHPAAVLPLMPRDASATL